jgi:hypothetical protein
MSERLCATCKHAGDVPSELRELAESVSKAYREVHYCAKRKAVMVYSPGVPSQSFECGDYEPRQRGGQGLSARPQPSA